MTTPHTPGPWKVWTTNGRDVQIDTADGRGTVVQPGAIQWEPDARLIAAAPEMRDDLTQHVDLLAGLLAFFEKGTHEWRVIEHRLRVTRALLARMEGKE